MKKIQNTENANDFFYIPETLFNYLFDWDYIFSPDGMNWTFDDKESIQEKIESHKESNGVDWLESVEYNGINYPTREVLIDGEFETISIVSLSKAIMNPENDLPLNDEAEAIDNDIFFYVDDADLDKSDDELVALIKESL